MRTGHILLLCILGAALLSSAMTYSANGPDDCCFEFYPRRVKKALIKTYYMTDHRCPLMGVIFITMKGRKLCLDPSLPWVQGVMTAADERVF